MKCGDIYGFQLVHVLSINKTTPFKAVRNFTSRSIQGGCPDGKTKDWTCEECGTNNFARRDECFKCGAKKPAEKWRPQIGWKGTHGNWCQWLEHIMTLVRFDKICRDFGPSEVWLYTYRHGAIHFSIQWFQDSKTSDVVMILKYRNFFESWRVKGMKSAWFF